MYMGNPGLIKYPDEKICIKNADFCTTDSMNVAGHQSPPTQNPYAQLV